MRNKTIKKDEQPKISIYIDFASIDNIELVKKIIENAKSIGKVVKTRVYFLQDEFEGHKNSVEEILSIGVEPIITMLAKDVKLAIDILDDSYDDEISIILLAYRYDSLLPALIDAKNRKTVYLIDLGGLSEALKNIADELIKV